MTDDSLRLLDVESNGVPVGYYDEEVDGCKFDFDPNVVPEGPPGSKPSDFDPPIIFTNTDYPGQQIPIDTIECHVVATDWSYEAGSEYSSYQVSILVGDVALTESSTLVPGDEGPLYISNIVTYP